ncbi:MAG: hypothetical protein A2Y88_14335 [Chloroflexi bacterium RBG_13_48_10]|nr:MAG: hypothetical protein A2Y88_14335 [Chloroflexi bacterium RBG_13_48_10]
MKLIHFLCIMRILFILTLLFSCWFSVSPVSATQEPSQPVVHAVLFYSPRCGHCQYIITESLLPLLEQYGEQLVIVGVDITSSGGQILFTSVLEYFNQEQSPVPFLVIGDSFLIGSGDIPEKFPGMVEQYLAQGGLDWPPIPGLAEALTQAQSTQAPTPQTTTQAPTLEVATQATHTSESTTPTPTILTPTPTTVGLILTDDINLRVGERLALDPTGNGLAVVVLVGMIITLIYGIILVRSSSKAAKKSSWNWLIPLLCIAGMAIAGYLAYVEITQAEAVCGPVGDCNTVQQSEYARLFGVLPIGIMGMVGYILILLAWVIGRMSNHRLAAYASLALLGMTSFGVLFSIYLTFLEPFVIGATCAWCLTSAIIMTLLFWLSLAPGKAALIPLFSGEKHGIERSGTSRAL